MITLKNRIFIHCCATVGAIILTGTKELKADQGKEEELFPLKYAIRTLSLVDKSLGMPYLVWSYFAAKFQSGNIVIHCGQKRNDTEESVNCLQKETYQWQLKMKLEN